jgi:hypothetical protein
LDDWPIQDIRPAKRDFKTKRISLKDVLTTSVAENSTCPAWRLSKAKLTPKLKSEHAIETSAVPWTIWAMMLSELVWAIARANVIEAELERLGRLKRLRYSILTRGGAETAIHHEYDEDMTHCRAYPIHNILPVVHAPRHELTPMRCVWNPINPQLRYYIIKIIRRVKEHDTEKYEPSWSGYDRLWEEPLSSRKTRIGFSVQVDEIIAVCLTNKIAVQETIIERLTNFCPQPR